MKQTKFLLLLLQSLSVFLFLAIPIQSIAQGQDAKHHWNGNPINSVVNHSV